ncbi:Aldehyde/histidinol dehydrogenase [Aspergillus filifer]
MAVIETRLFINGEFVHALDGSTFTLKSPFSGKTVAEVAEAKAEDVDRAVECAKRAFPAWEGLDGSERRRLMLKLFADLVDEHAAEFARLEALSMGKPVAGYMDQVMGTATLRCKTSPSKNYPCMVFYYADKALDIHGITLLTSKNHLNISLRQPYGVTGAIIPWNVLLIMLCFKVGPSLIAGNEAGFPPGVLNILPGLGVPCSDAVARHMEIRKIAFTESTRTGKFIQKAATEPNLKSCTLELGPLIVFDDADLERAAAAAAFSIVTNSGQVCMASSRVYVHSSVAGRPGDPDSKETSFGPQADEQQMKSVMAYLQLAQRDRLLRLRLRLGGFKGSGTGRELGDEGLQAWAETKSVFISLP